VAPYAEKLLTHLDGQVLAVQQLAVARLPLMRFVGAGQDYLLTTGCQLVRHLNGLLRQSLLMMRVKDQQTRPPLSFLEQQLQPQVEML
jgi:hypothetical protein